MRMGFSVKEDFLRQRRPKRSRLTYACSASGFSTSIVLTSRAAEIERAIRVWKSSLRSSSSGEFVYGGQDDRLSRLLPTLRYRNAV